MSTIQCNIVSPEGELFSGPVELLSAEGGAGEIAITPRHAPLLTNLKPVRSCLVFVYANIGALCSCIGVYSCILYSLNHACLYMFLPTY